MLLWAAVAAFGAAAGPSDAGPGDAPGDANLTATQQSWVRAVATGKGAALSEFPTLTPTQAAAVEAAQEAWWSNFHDYHVAYSMSVEVTYTARDRATLTGYGDCGDSALWTGSYLAATVHRYAVTKEPHVLARIQATVGVYENLTRVSGKLGFMCATVTPPSLGAPTRADAACAPGAASWA